MATNWKRLYEEAVKENEQLRKQLDDSRREMQRTGEVVDLAGIAWHMKADRHTPQQWRQRKLLPPVDFPRIKEPLWYAATIKEQFAEATRRIWYDNPDDEDLSPAA